MIALQDIEPDKIFKTFLGTFTSLFSVINPLGAMPIFIALTTDHGQEYQKLMSRKASIYMVIILAFFLLAGTYLMSFFGISIEAIRIAGGAIVFRSGFLLLTPRENNNLSKKSKLEALEKPDISLTPLALPILSGPGSIAATLSYATHATRPFRLIILGSIIAVGLITYLCLVLSSRLVPYMGKSGLEAVTKLMGFLSMVIGVQFIMNGVQSYIEKGFLN
jgi:multiple antibiotic resistance protein